MKKYFKDLLKVISLHLISLTLIVGGFVAYAVSFPTTDPGGGAPTGGAFMVLMKKILVNPNPNTTDGTVNQAVNGEKLIGQTACPSGEVINGFDSNGNRTCTLN